MSLHISRRDFYTNGIAESDGVGFEASEGVGLWKAGRFIDEIIRSLTLTGVVIATTDGVTAQ